MKKQIALILLTIAILGGGIGLYVAFGDKPEIYETTVTSTDGSAKGAEQGQADQSGQTSTGSAHGADSSGSLSGSAGETTDAVSTDQVKIVNFNYAPGTITVKVGTKVTWTNADTVKHNVAMNDGADGPSSPMLAKGDSYTYTFTKAGTYNYHCTPHPNMKGMVIVTE